MCGIVGLFTGCDAFTACPKILLQKQPPGSAVPEEASALDYQSPFGSWYQRSAVRDAPRRMLSPTDDRYPFSPDLVPVARHPAVRALPPASFRAVLTQHAYRYLDFTAKLEHLVVNRTVLGIAHDTLGVSVPEEMRFDAYKIYCDEAYHALFSVDLIRQLRDSTGILPQLDAEPYLLRRLAAIQEAAGPEFAGLVEVLFVICSETLISATLAEVPDDPGVVTVVKDLIRDHAKDEGRHHAYFASFLRILWAQLDPAMRRVASRLVPRLIKAFLEPDRPAVRAELLGYGLTRDTVEGVLDEVYHPVVVSDHVRRVARKTVEYFTAVGALEDSAARAEFEHYLLVG